jgi:hypothetical protein
LFGMDHERRIAKVLPFLRPTRADDVAHGRHAARIPKHSRCPWLASKFFWLAWWAMAWMIAASRLKLAVIRREVFGFDATLAFLVAVVLPLMCSPLLLEPARRAYHAIVRFRELHAAPRVSAADRSR